MDGSVFQADFSLAREGDDVLVAGSDVPVAEEAGLLGAEDDALGVVQGVPVWVVRRVDLLDVSGAVVAGVHSD